MEQVQSARRSSGLYDIDVDVGSTASLARNVAPPSGSRFSEGPEIQRATGAGVVPAAGGAQSSGLSDAGPAPEGNATQPATPVVPWYKRRKFLISQAIIIPLGIALLFILLFPVVSAIAQLVVNRSVINIDEAAISSPQNESDACSQVTHTGVISATISFTKPVSVSWVQDNGTQTPLGIMELHTLHASGKRATIDDTTLFNITQEGLFGQFAEHMITAENFTWRLFSDDLRVQAAKFPVSKGIKFDKLVTLKGFNSFSNSVVLKDLKLPGDNPESDGGGIKFTTINGLNNPSPFSLNLGTVLFSLSYSGTDLGIGTSTNTIINPNSNDIGLKGFLKPQEADADIKAVSDLFTNYLNGDKSDVIARGQSTLQDDGTAISWLSQGLRALELHVPFVSLQGAISPIKTITIGDLALLFTEPEAWSPTANSNNVHATMELPFGFSVDIGKIQNTFNISRNGETVAGLSTPLGASQSDISVLSSTKTAGTINITIEDTKLNTDHPNFAAFNANITSGELVDFRLIGHARAVANMSVGQLTLDPIKFNVSASLDGLQGLKGMTKIDDVDVQGGTEDGITLGITVTIQNPSNLQLSTGDLISYDSSSANVCSPFRQPNDNDQGLQTLNDFVGQKDVSLAIVGYDGSTDIASLSEAFQTLDIDVVLPGLKTALLNKAALEVLTTTGRDNNISHVTVDLQNPFSAALQITNIKSTVSSFGISLGTIDTDTDFNAEPKSTTTSPALNFNMNLEPSAIFTLTRNLAVEAGLDTAQLDGIVKAGGISYMQDVEISSQTRRDNLYTGFDLPTFVQSAFTKLKSDVELSSEVTIGDYRTTLTYTQDGVVTGTDDTLDYILPVLAQPIVQKIVTGSVLGIDSVLISDPQQSSFVTTLKGSITDAGPFDATISFGSGLTVSWSGKPLGTIKMDDLDITGDVGGDISMESQFVVADTDHLTAFTKVLLTEESFQWEITGENLTVSALGIDVDGIALTIQWSQGGVVIQSFDLPENDPDGGIHLTLQATTDNPSQVGIELSSLGFETYFGDVMIAPVASEGVTLSPGSTTNMSLAGRLVPQDSDAGLAAVSTDSDVVVRGASAGPSDVTWLNEGIKSLLIATVLPNQGVLNIIKSISLNELELIDSTDAAFTLPFGFPVDIVSVEQTITVSYNGQSFAQLAIPRGPSTTDVEDRIIHLSFSDVPFAVFDNTHSVFNDFVAATTMGDSETMGLSGSANTDASTAVGILSLTDIDFDVQSTIDGLQGLNAEPVTVSDLDVFQGFPDYLLIKVNSPLFNPSNLTIGTEDVSFGLLFQDQTIGSANLNLVAVHFSPQGSAETAGRILLENYIQGVDSDTTIHGSTDSTHIESLKEALSQIVLSPVTIPAMHDTLIKSTSLTFPIDIVKTGIASASFTLANPFTASINLLTVGTTATFQGIVLGIINADVSSNPIHADGHSSVTSQTLNMDYNLNPLSIIAFISAASKANSVDIGPLTDLFEVIVQNPQYNPPVTTTVDTEKPTCVRISKLILAIDSSLKLDEYATELSFNQTSVPAITDDTALYLIGAVAGPVAQVLVDQSVLAFSEANITNISDEGFDLSLVGSLLNTGPLDALIAFTEPVTVTWQGTNIAEIALDPICAAANDGVPNYNTQARLTITNTDRFTTFATYLLHNEDFEWTISTDKLRLNALGTIFDNISLEKKVSFKAFNNLPGVTISNFKLPSDDDAGGIHIETDALIPSSAQLGIDLGTVGFQTFYGDTNLGPLSASNLFLTANAATRTHLSGRIVPQSGGDLDNVGVLFSDFLAGKNSTLLTKGDSVQPDGSSGPVGWLSTAFKTLELSVTLPGEKFDVIKTIALSDLAVTIQNLDETFNPPTSSNNTVATYANPFGFSLEVFQSSQEIVMNGHGVDIASLSLPMESSSGGVSTGNDVDLQISWTNKPLVSLNDGAFVALFAAVTLSASVDLTLKGTADVRAHTTIGDVPISGIEFNVDSSLVGINAFGGTTVLSNVSVTGATSEYIISPLKSTLDNPSEVTLHTTDVALPVVYDGTVLGRAIINPYDLLPGTIHLDSEFHYMPSDANDTTAQAFLTRFMTTGDDIPLTISGDADSTPYASLQGALGGIKLSTTLPGMNQPTIITSIHVTITLETLVDNLVTIDFDVFNPFDTPITITFVQSDAGVEGDVYAFFSEPIDGFTIGPGETVNSGPVPNVLLVKGVDDSLGIVGLGYLDVATANTIIVNDGYEIPWLKLQQDRVPTTYNFSLSFDAMKAAAESVSASSVSQTASESASGSSSTGKETSTTTASADGDEETSSTVKATATASASDEEPASETSTEATATPSSDSSAKSSSQGDSSSDESTDASSNSTRRSTNEKQHENLLST
ncbi:hypothetical protein BDZ89DRAFT_1056905 [Hymenopellis radicata]|nr:hypothetical protein BDZ89DRAFT_1056905 [Hymenopellis radicata]